jgi:drug/metabolite transporter (DMT)-like permease
MDTKTKGILAVLGASVMWAVEPITAKLAYTDSDFIETSLVRAIIAALIGFFYVFITNSRKLVVTKKQFSALIYIAIVGTVFADLLYFFSLSKVPVLNAVLIGHMQPIFIVLIGFFLLKEDRLSVSDYLGILTMIFAGIFVTAKTPANLQMLKLGTIGDMYVVLATAAWATTAVVMRKYLRQLNAGTVTFYRFSMGAALLTVYVSLTSSLVISNIYQILVGVVVGTGTILYYEGLKRIKAAQVSALELATPFFVVLFSFLVLGELTTIMQLFGIALLWVGVYLLSKREPMYF